MTASTMDFFDFSCDALYPSINELVFGSQIEPTTQRVNSEDIMTTGMLATLNSNDLEESLLRGLTAGMTQIFSEQNLNVSRVPNIGMDPHFINDQTQDDETGNLTLPISMMSEANRRYELHPYAESFTSALQQVAAESHSEMPFLTSSLTPNILVSTSALSLPLSQNQAMLASPTLLGQHTDLLDIITLQNTLSSQRMNDWSNSSATMERLNMSSEIPFLPTSSLTIPIASTSRQSRSTTSVYLDQERSENFDLNRVSRSNITRSSSSFPPYMRSRRQHDGRTENNTIFHNRTGDLEAKFHMNVASRNGYDSFLRTRPPESPSTIGLHPMSLSNASANPPATSSLAQNDRMYNQLRSTGQNDQIDVRIEVEPRNINIGLAFPEITGSYHHKKNDTPNLPRSRNESDSSAKQSLLRGTLADNDIEPGLCAAIQVAAARQLLVQATASAAAAGTKTFSQTLDKMSSSLDRIMSNHCSGFLGGGHTKIRASLSLRSPASPKSSHVLIPTCSICLDKIVSIILLPCRHFFCDSCAPKIKKCGLCRKAIEKRHHVFF